jgi:hypothetical protein
MTHGMMYDFHLWLLKVRELKIKKINALSDPIKETNRN